MKLTSKRPIYKDPRNVAKVVITDYLTKVEDVNAMRAGLHMLQTALSREYIRGSRPVHRTSKAEMQWQRVEK